MHCSSHVLSNIDYRHYCLRFHQNSNECNLCYKHILSILVHNTFKWKFEYTGPLKIEGNWNYNVCLNANAVILSPMTSIIFLWVFFNWMKTFAIHILYIFYPTFSYSIGPCASTMAARINMGDLVNFTCFDKLPYRC